MREEVAVATLCVGIVFLSVGVIYGFTGTIRANATFNDLLSLQTSISQSGLNHYTQLVNAYQWAWLEPVKTATILSIIGVTLLIVTFVLSKTSIKQPV